MEQQTSEDPSKEKGPNTGAEQSSLRVSDWVTFLSNEKQVNLSMFLGLAAMLMAAVAMISAASTDPLLTIVFGSGFLLALFAYVYFKLYKPLQRRYMRSRDTLDQIMQGKLRQVEDIRKVWDDAQAMKERKGSYSHLGVGQPLAGALWLAGWLFTIAYASLPWWKIILALVVWPYFLGLAVR